MESHCYGNCNIARGIWASPGSFSFDLHCKINEQRDAKQEEREKNYQTVIENLTEKIPNSKSGSE